MSDRTLPRLGQALLLVVVVPFAACEGCAPTVPAGSDAGGGDPSATCNVDFDCQQGEQCQSGHCAPIVIVPDAGPSTDAGSDAGSEGTGVLSALPSALIEFGAVRIGVPVQQQITLANIGDAPLTVLQVFLDDNPTGEFSAAPIGSVNTVLNPGDTTALLVTHTPIDGIPDVASLKIVHTASDDQLFEIELVADFKGTPSISVSDDVAVLDPNLESVALGAVPVGNFIEKQLFVRNDGSSDSVLTVTNATLTPATAGFTLELPDLNAAGTLSSFAGLCPSGDVLDCPTNAAACTDGLCVDDDGALLDALPLRVRFTPTEVGSKQATLTLHYDLQGSDQQLDIALSADGVTGNLLATPGAVSFSPAFTSRAEYTQTITLENTGAAAATIEGFAWDEAGAFEVTHSLTFPHILNAGESATVDVSFYSDAEGAFTDTLTVLSDQDEDLAIPLSADARHEPTILVDDALDFGGVYGGTSKALPVTIRNAGPGVLNIDDISITGTGAARYSIGALTLPAELQPLAHSADTTPNVLVQLTYSPDAAPSPLPDLALLEIDSDDPDAPSVSIELSGQSIKPIISPTATLVAFGEAPACDAVPDRTVDVRNTGYGPLVITAATLSGDPDFTVTPSAALPATLDFNESLTFTVGFAAAAAGARTATLTITSTDGALPNTTVTLTATSALLDGTTVDTSGGTCTYSCASGFVDLDGDLNVGTPSPTGCEYPCTFTSAVDPPDGAFTDANCDGTDGDVTKAIFVAGNGSNAPLTDGGGTMAQPMLTISYALTQATAAGRNQLYVSNGLYEERVTLKNGVSIYGGYSRADSWKRAAGNTTIIEQDVVTSGRVIAVQGSNITSATTVADLTISALTTSAPGASVYGVHCSGCSGVRFERNFITAGDGGPGVGGLNGDDGPVSNGGSEGDDGAKDNQGAARAGGAGGTSSCSRPGGDGGDGGWENRSGEAGDKGSSTTSGGGTAGTAGSKHGCSGGGDGGGGGKGDNGSHGSDGSGGSAGGTIVGGFWVGNDGASGTSGTSGHGGGGGGGGGGQGEDGCCSICTDGAGGGGGGGGSGGCRGTRGTRGTAGGGSFGVFLHNSTNAVLSGNIITSGNGGDGGRGGTGGDGASGGAGAAGGNCCNGDEVGMGGNGGNGGYGGDGGDGGGGAGGDSFAVYRSSTSVSVSGNTLDNGNGGDGGFSVGNDGADGLSGNVN